MVENNTQLEGRTEEKSKKKELKKVQGDWTIAEIKISYKPITTTISKVTSVEDVHQ